MFEYGNFSEHGNPTIVRREAGSTDDWETCADDDVDARVAMGIKQYKKEERMRLGAPRIATVMIPAPKNIAIGEKLGLGTGDEAGINLAIELESNKPTETVRVPEAEFDGMAKELSMSKDEIRKRFKGEFVKQEY